MFEREGRISDIFLSRKKRRMTIAPFAFVRYFYRGKVENMINNLNGLVIQDHKIMVSEAKYKRRYERIEGNNNNQE